MTTRLNNTNQPQQETTTMKLAHLHLRDPFGNPSTLIARLDDGSIRYVYYSGHGSSGTPLAESNLQVALPVDNDDGLTVDQWRDRLVDIIDSGSVRQVVRVVTVEVTFPADAEAQRRLREAEERIAELEWADYVRIARENEEATR